MWVAKGTNIDDPTRGVVHSALTEAGMLTTKEKSGQISKERYPGPNDAGLNSFRYQTMLLGLPAVNRTAGSTLVVRTDGPPDDAANCSVY
jgi:hypothetical protein